MSDRAQSQQIGQRPQQIIKKRRKAARPYTQAQGRKFRIKKTLKGASSRARGRGERGATRRVQGGERGGCTFPTTKTTYGKHFKFFFNTLRL